MRHSHLLKLLLSAAILPALAVFFIEVSAQPATTPKSDKKQLFTDADLQVERAAGRGIVSTAPDSQQANDPSVPVVVKLINTYYGGGPHAGRIKIPEAKIENRYQKVTRSIQLRWVIAKKAEPDIVLLEGVTPFFEARVAPYDAPLLDIPPIYYNKIVRPLLKGGQMNEDIRLTVGIQEVQFEDGTRWQRIRQAAFLKTTFISSPPGSRFQRFKPSYHLNLPPSPELKLQPLTPSPCR